MAWTRYLLHGFFTASDLERIDRRLNYFTGSQSRMRSSTTLRVGELDEDLGRLALLTRALADLCV